MIPAGVKRLVILNKVDLASPSMTKQYLEYIKETEKVECFGLSASKYYEIENLLNYVQVGLKP
jgi:ribosome biogenesis GTPase A